MFQLAAWFVHVPAPAGERWNWAAATPEPPASAESLVRPMVPRTLAASAGDITGTISNIDLTRSTFQLEGKTYTASPTNTVGAKLSELKEGDQVRIQSEETTGGKEPYNVLTMKKVD